MVIWHWIAKIKQTDLDTGTDQPKLLQTRNRAAS